MWKIGEKWEREAVKEESSAKVSVGVCLSSVWQAISEHIGHIVWSPLPSDHQPGSSSRTYADGGCLCVSVREIKGKCDIVSSPSRACVSDSRNLFIGPTSSLECVYLALIHTSFVHAHLWMLCCNANLNEPPCPLLCANANVYISSFTAVSLSSSLSKGQTSRTWILCFFPLVLEQHPSSLALSFFPPRLLLICSPSALPSLLGFVFFGPLWKWKRSTCNLVQLHCPLFSSLLFSDFFLFSRFCSSRFCFVIHLSLNLIMFLFLNPHYHDDNLSVLCLNYVILNSKWRDLHI